MSRGKAAQAHRFLIGCLFVLATILGCRRPSNDDYIPAPNLAREALAAALEAWQQDEAVPTQTNRPKIEFIDTERASKRSLKSYEIIGEIPTKYGRRFEVKLLLNDALQPVTVQYVIIGIDPLWVFSQQDYDMVTHWDHPMPAPEEEKEVDKSERRMTNDQ
jgi:hypothetical protein